MGSVCHIFLPQDFEANFPLFSNFATLFRRSETTTRLLKLWWELRTTATPTGELPDEQTMFHFALTKIIMMEAGKRSGLVHGNCTRGLVQRDTGGDCAALLSPPKGCCQYQHVETCHLRKCFSNWDEALKHTLREVVIGLDLKAGVVDAVSPVCWSPNPSLANNFASGLGVQLNWGHWNGDVDVVVRNAFAVHVKLLPRPRASLVFGYQVSFFPHFKKSVAIFQSFFSGPV